MDSDSTCVYQIVVLLREVNQKNMVNFQFTGH